MPVSEILGGIIEWSVASLPRRGEVESGDCSVVKFAGDEVLAAVVDGVGHGEEALAAARLVTDILQEFSGQQSLTELMNKCHEKLRGTRGAVASMAILNVSSSTLTWLGVGNIEGQLLRSEFRFAESSVKVQETLLLRGGVLGHRLPHLISTTVSLNYGDLLVFATDGVRPDFAGGIYNSSSVQRMAQSILDHFALGTDDALVLAVRYLHE